MTLEELRRLYDWSLPGQRLYGLTPADHFYIVAKVDVETDEPVYPRRPSEHQAVTEEAQVEVYRVKQEIVDTVTRRLNVQEHEAWRKNEEFWAALKDHQPLKQYLTADERESVRRIWNRIWRRAGSVLGAGKDNWEHVARTPFQREFPSKDKSKYRYPTGR